MKTQITRDIAKMAKNTNEFLLHRGRLMPKGFTWPGAGAQEGQP